MTLQIDIPADIERLSFPEGLDRRLHALLDKQDSGQSLSPEEAAEAEGLVELAELLSVIKLRAAIAAQS